LCFLFDADAGVANVARGRALTGHHRSTIREKIPPHASNELSRFRRFSLQGAASGAAPFVPEFAGVITIPSHIERPCKLN